MSQLTYEAYLDEVATLLTELYDLEDEAAIKLVVDAQDAEYFSPHDDHPDMRTLTRAREDAVALFQAWQNRKATQQHQQKRQHQAKQRRPQSGKPPGRK
jgi:hypothetical protein